MIECMKEVPSSKGRCCCNCRWHTLYITWNVGTREINEAKYLCSKSNSIEEVKEMIRTHENIGCALTKIWGEAKTARHGLCDLFDRGEKICNV